MTKMREMLRNGMIRTYVAYKNALTNRKGSPTVEYVVVVMAAAALATLLLTIINSDGTIKNAIKDKIENAIKSAGGQ